MRAHRLSAPPSVDPNTTLPLWMYVTTSSKPCFSKQTLSAVILIRLLPPTLIPRSSATYRFMTVDCYHTRAVDEDPRLPRRVARRFSGVAVHAALNCRLS